MKKLSDTLKRIVKNPAGKETFGTDPKDPWSPKAGLSEGSLETYLKSKGINPEYVSKDQKIAHAKSMAYLKWKSEHQFEEVVVEEPIHISGKSGGTASQKSSIEKKQHSDKIIKTPRGPGLHRQEGSQMTQLTPESTALDKFRAASAEREKKYDEIEKNRKSDAAQGKENMKSAIDRLEKHMKKEDMNPDSPKAAAVSKELKNITKRGVIMKPTNEEQIDENEHLKKLQADIDKSAEQEVAHAKKHGWKVQKQTYGRTYTHPKHGHIDMNRYGEWQHRPQSGIMRGKGNLIAHGEFKDLDKHISSLKEEVESIDELNKDTLKSYRDKSMASIKNARKNRDAAEPGKNMSKGFADLFAKSDSIAKKRAKGLAGYLQRKHGMKPGYSDERKTTSEAVGDKEAADHADGLTTAVDQMQAETKRQMSKSARMIKALYKKHKMVKEDLYDHEKEDKSVATYGKKPKEEKADKDASKGENKPQAALTLSGGTTLTGNKRDTVEIDPMMRNRPGQPDPTKKDDKKKDDKKEDKKKDK